MVASCQLLTLPRHCRLDIETSLRTPRAFKRFSPASKTEVTGRIMLTSKAVSAISSHPGLYLQSRHLVCFRDLRRQPGRQQQSYRV